jgi:hypothetical protein
MGAVLLVFGTAQQGLIHLVRGFCDHGKLPELVKDWTAQDNESADGV